MKQKIATAQPPTDQRTGFSRHRFMKEADGMFAAATSLARMSTHLFTRTEDRLSAEMLAAVLQDMAFKAYKVSTDITLGVFTEDPRAHEDKAFLALVRSDRASDAAEAKDTLSREGADLRASLPKLEERFDALVEEAKSHLSGTPEAKTMKNIASRFKMLGTVLDGLSETITETLEKG
jgi:hypothetical protein